MKKLALALVCLIGVAFLTSCDPVVQNPEPSIAILAEEGFLTDGQVIDMDVVYPYGFIAASNPETQKELAKLVIVCGDATLCDTVISGTEFIFKGEIYFTNNEEEREISGSAEIKATVTDAAGESKTAIIKVDINEEIALVPTDFTWNRHGGAAATGLEEFGLTWTSNAKEIYAVIKPLEGATLIKFDDPTIWETTQTAAQKNALFPENALGVAQFKEVSCTAEDKDYDIVLGTIYNGETHLIHVTHSHVFTFKGTDVTITGQAK